MPKYLIQGSYTEQGVKGVLKEGGSKRKEAVEQMMKAMGGRVEALYYAFGSDDFVIIVDAPSQVDFIAAGLIANSSGMLNVRTTVLIAPEEIDEAVKRTVKFRPPGQ